MRTWPLAVLEMMFVNLMLLTLQKNMGLLQKIQQEVKILVQILLVSLSIPKASQEEI